MWHSFIQFFNKELIIAVASLCSILGLGLSLWLLFLTWNIKDKIYWVDDIKRFNGTREVQMNKLSGYKDSMYKDKINDQKLISDLIQQVYYFQSFNRVNSVRDKYVIYWTLKNLNSQKINKRKLNTQLTYIISRYALDKGGIIQ